MKLADITEKAWDAQLFGSKKGLATMTGWKLTYHTLRSKGSQSGFPDRVLVRERVIFVELKREKTKPTESQEAWLDGLALAGAEVYVVRPRDLDEFARVLTHRGRPDWTPSCAWKWSTQPQGCWPWTRAMTNRGYGNVLVEGANRPAHRVTYETFRGPIPEGFDLHHLCANRDCVNPWHLTALSHAEHASLDSANARKEFCAQKHPFNEENTYVDGEGNRHCRTCRREVNQRWRARRAFDLAREGGIE